MTERFRRCLPLFLILFCLASASVPAKAYAPETAAAKEALPSAKKTVGWVKKGNYWYYYSKKTGKLLKNTLTRTSSGTYYYFLNDGRMATGMTKTGTYYRYFASNGKMVTGWKTIGGKTYYFNASGVRRSGLLLLGKKRYYLGTNGVLQKGWLTVNNKKYYADPANGYALTVGWKKSDAGNAYYFNSTGIMQTGWKTIGGTTYCFYTSGKMARDTWVEGKYVDGNGVYQPNGDSTSQETAAEVRMRWPLDARWNDISSYFGHRPSPGGIGSTNHQGVDIPANQGQKIYAAAAGTIVIRQFSSSAGYYIELNHGKSLNTQYMHMSRFEPNLAVGGRVKKGQVIGYVGSTGNSTGPHLHFGVKQRGAYKNPLSFVKQP